MMKAESIEELRDSYMNNDEINIFDRWVSEVRVLGCIAQRGFRGNTLDYNCSS